MPNPFNNTSFTKIKTIDMHTGGEPLRIILEGYPDFPKLDILEVRRQLSNQFDHLRKVIMWEPRGHYDMYGLLKVKAQRQDSDFGVIFMHNEGYSTMCGHATIAITKAAIDLDWVKMLEPLTTIKIDAPCGQLTSYATVENGNVTGMSFDNVPSFFVGTYNLELPPFGNIQYDLAYGGAFYAYTDISQFNLDCEPHHSQSIIELGKRLKQAVIDTNKDIIHPLESDLSFLYGCIFIDEVNSKNIHSKNVCIFANGELDRCATGSGVSGRAAIHYAKGELVKNEKIKIASIIGSTLEVEVTGTTQFGPYKAIIPRVYGSAYYTGTHEFWIDPKDPLKDGFLVT